MMNLLLRHIHRVNVQQEMSNAHRTGMTHHSEVMGTSMLCAVRASLTTTSEDHYRFDLAV